MATDRTKRKLSAILSADVIGYSRLMGEDELATIDILKEYREVLRTLINQYNGRVVDSPGDNLLAEFSSVVDAVECAVKIQEQLYSSNTALSEARRMEYRIGINLGDVIEDEDCIYGDGINIAARIEGMAEGGGICISGTAYDQVKNKLNLGFKFLGKHTVKNISDPVRVYRIRPESKTVVKATGHKRKKLGQWQKAALSVVSILIISASVWAIFNFYPLPVPNDVASVEKMVLPLPDKPSIAVLPFDNMSSDPDQEYFADGISENIISALSHIPEMFVIARNSTFTYKGKSVKVQQVSEELGVRYVLEGSVQKSGDRIRVSAQLIDAITGHHLWAERYDRKLKDIFALQDEITLKILTALQVKLTEGEQANRWNTTDNLEAWGNVIKGSSLFEQFERQSNSSAQKFYELAVNLDPNWDVAWTMLAWTYWAEARFGWTDSPAESINRAVEITKKVATINDTLPELHLLWSNIYLFQGDPEKAISAGKKAIALGPNNALSHVLLAYAMNFAGRFEEAIELGEKAVRLSPYSAPWYLMILNDAYRMAGSYEEALAVGKHYLNRCRKGECNPFMAHMGLAQTYIGLGRIEDARIHSVEMLKIDPDFSLDQARKVILFKDPAHKERALNDLRQAGLPEHTTLLLPDKPSIAVLPFTNMSDDLKQEYFSDGITEDLITDLSKISGLFVIARNSVFTYKGKSIKVEEVGRQLGVRYVLEGSVRKADARVRITAQLVDTKTGGHMWAERYDRDLKDIFALQDEVTQKIVNAMVVELTGDEQKRLGHRVTENFEAYDFSLRGWDYFFRLTKKANVQAREMFERAIDLDPKYALAYTGLGFTHFIGHSFGWIRDPHSLDRALELAYRSISLDDSLYEAHSLLGKVHLWKKQYDQAIAELEKTIALNPNYADGLVSLGEVFYFADRPEEAIGLIKKAIRLNPIPPVWYFHGLGHSNFLVGRYEEAIRALKKAIDRNPNFWPAYIYLAACYVEIGKEDSARAEVAKLLKVNPNFSIQSSKHRLPYKDPAIFKRLSDTLRKAGLK
jgi:adenylate cyclase